MKAAVYVNRAILLVSLFSATLCAQTTILSPAGGPADCQGEECVPAAHPSAEAEKGQTLRFRNWQLDDVATSGELDPAWKHRGRPGRAHSPGEDERAQEPSETEFQRFVHLSTGLQLPIYGANLFREIKTFAPKDRASVPADYMVGPGDHLLIHIWGLSDVSLRTIVDRNGQIFLPKAGMLSVMGLRFDELAPRFKQALGHFFRHFDLSVSLGELRKINVFVVGRARRPGSYAVSSLTTLTNALFVSGGPAGNGSMRRIQLRREGKIVSQFDVYDLLLKGDTSRDAALQSGDVIYIPPLGPVVAVAGSVNQPAIYEMEEGATVAEQIAAAGGLSATADDTRAILERIEGRSSRKVEEFALDAGNGLRRLRDGDVLRVFPISPRFDNAVTLRGNVAQPGRYPWHAGMRIADLIPSPEAIITSGYWVGQNMLAGTGAGWIEESQRKLPVPSVSPDNRPATASPGALQPRPPETELPNRGSSVRTRAEGGSAEVNWDYALVQRLDRADLSSRLLPFNLGHALSEPGSADDLLLQAGDVVTVFSQQDLAVPVAKRTQLVWVEGEVGASGIYRARPGETLRDIVQRAGGLTPQAYLFAADFRRESTRREQQEKLERMVEEMDRELQAQTEKLSLSQNSADQEAGREQLDREQAILGKLKQTRPTGRIVLDLKTSDREISALPALPLEDGDRIRIPSRPAVVEVAGQVYNQNAFLYREERSLGDYLRQAGGGTRDADAGRLFVIRADGSVLSKQMRRSLWSGSFAALKLAPGDTIVMPERIRSGTLMRGLRDWSQVFAQFALGAAAVKVISP